MASHLQELQMALEEFGQNARSTAESLSSYGEDFSRQRDHIASLLQGTSRRTDQEVIDSVDEAERELREAQQALSQAAQVAIDYAHDL